MKLRTLGFIGGGRITRIFLHGFENKSIKFESVKVFDPNLKTQNELQNSFPQVDKVENAEAAASGQQVVFIAVHPPMVMDTLQKIKTAVSENTIIISLAPKITIEKMESVLPTRKIVRMIPNATSCINKGYNPVSFADGFDKKEKKAALKLLKKLGKTFETEEPKLESYTIVSAMLPTYFWFQWQEMEKIGVETGLTPAEARKAVHSTLKKALKLYYDSEMNPDEVMDLIPVKPIGENEPEIKNILNSKLMGLFGKIKP
jgi:pyrroline-5-carboxylate reductase